MEKKHYASIDIGSNAVRLLIKCYNGESSGELMSKVQLIRVPLRLGGDAFTEGKIKKKKVRKLLHLMKAYKHLMEIYEVEAYRACATSAMRDASNHKEIVEMIYQETGLLIEVITGGEEALLLSDSKVEELIDNPSKTFLYCDVGGGSTELNLVREGQLLESQSFNIGTIRLLNERVSLEEWERFKSYLAEIHERYPKLCLIGSGGNINKLLRLGAPSERGRVNFLSLEALREVVVALRGISPEERILRYQLKPDRADVIVPAGELFLLVLEELSLEGIIVPTKGLADGILDSLLRRIEAGF